MKKLKTDIDLKIEIFRVWPYVNISKKLKFLGHQMPFSLYSKFKYRNLLTHQVMNK